MPLCISSAGRTGRGMASAGAARRRHNDGTGVLPAPRRNLRASRVENDCANAKGAPPPAARARACVRAPRRARDGARTDPRYALARSARHALCQVAREMRAWRAWRGFTLL